ncbi:MAG: MATE family efflux transporter [Mangrovibacterium sp.]
MRTYFSTYKNILQLAFPVMLSQLGHVTVQLADNMMVGRVGTTELAAASFANSVFVLGMLFGTGICMGLTPLAGKAFLKRNGNQLASYLKNGLILSLSLGAIIALILLAISFFLDFMGQTPEVAQLAQPYMWVLILSLVPLMIFSTFKQFLEGLGNTKVAMVIVIASNAINILFNYLLIFGKWGFPELGLLGAGLSTLIARFFMPIAIFIYFKTNSRFQNIRSRALASLAKLSEMKKLLQIGVPIGVQVVFEVLIFSLSGIMMGWIGETELAAHQVTVSITTVAYMISLGIGSATTIRVSHNLGAGDWAQIKRLIFASSHLTVGLMGSVGIMLITFRYQLPTLFTTDPNVIKISAQLFIVAALFQVFDSLQVALLAVLRGLTDVTVPMVLAFVSYLVIGTPVCYLCAFSFGMGPIGIWWGLLISLMMAAGLFAFRLRQIVFLPKANELSFLR